MSGRLGELLVNNGLITPKQLEEALREQKLSGNKLGSCLVKLGFMSEKNLVSFLSRHYGVPAIDLTEVQIDLEAIKTIPPDVIFKYQAIPLKRTARPQEIAGVIAFLASSDADYITGQVVCIDGGLTM